MNVLKKLLLISIVLFPQALFAEEESWYQVEVIVFDRLYPELDGEQWLSQPFQSKTNLVELLPAATSLNNKVPVPFSLLPASKNRLSGSERVLRLSSNFRPLLHYSWQQLATVGADARFVHIQKLAEDSLDTAPEPMQADAEPAFIESVIEPDRLVDGAIRVRSGFYLHVDVDLSYFMSLPQENRIVQIGSDTQNEDPFAKIPIRLKESRKIKLNEIHYFDHPMFGVIIQVSRLNAVL